MWKCDPTFGDVNGDGFVDLAALPRLGFGPRVWLGDGTGRWTESSEGLNPRQRSCGGGLHFGDANNDGFQDLIVADHCQGVFVYLGDGAGGWEMVTQALCPKNDALSAFRAQMHLGAEDLAIGDVNGDGNLDIVVGGSDDGGINVYFGDGSGREWTLQDDNLPKKEWANRVVLADVNDDGRLDLLASSGAGPRVWLGDGSGGWTPSSEGLPSPMLKGLYNGLDVGDINGDGRMDFVTANWVDGPEIYLQQSDGSWKKTPDAFPQLMGGAIGVALGDLDLDGNLDIVLSGRMKTDPGFVRGVFALRGDGSGGMSYMEGTGLLATGLAAMGGVAVEDINGDGVLDVVAGSGLIVETAPGPKEPVIPQRLPLWCGKLRGAADRDKSSTNDP